MQRPLLTYISLPIAPSHQMPFHQSAEQWLYLTMEWFQFIETPIINSLIVFNKLLITSTILEVGEVWGTLPLWISSTWNVEHNLQQVMVRTAIFHIAFWILHTNITNQQQYTHLFCSSLPLIPLSSLALPEIVPAQTVRSEHLIRTVRVNRPLFEVWDSHLCFTCQF